MPLTDPNLCYEAERKKQTIMGLKKTNGAWETNVVFG